MFERYYTRAPRCGRLREYARGPPDDGVPLAGDEWRSTPHAVAAAARGLAPEVDAITLLSVVEHPVPASDVRALVQAFAAGSAASKLRAMPPVFHPMHLFDFKSRVPRVVALRLAGVPYVAAKWDSRELRRALRRELEGSATAIAYLDFFVLVYYLLNDLL